MIIEGVPMSQEIETPTNPFPGLRPFQFDESHLYFGRDGQSEQLLRKLSSQRFMVVVGTSGSGKSSLVRAGLLPDLFGGFMSSAGSHWRVAMMRPANDPLGNLALALNTPDVFGSDIEENAELQTTINEATLRRGGLGLVEAVRQNRMPANENLLVVVDQFEELFRFARVSGDEQYQYEAASFVKLLLEATRQREFAIYVVLTMRSDFLGDCSLFWDLPEAINEGQYLIPRLTREQRREAITGPIAVCGGEITPRLVSRLLNDMGDNPDQLPILQHALMRTWEKWREEHESGEPMDLRHYEAIGSMAEALSRHADEAFNELPDERSRELAEIIFKGLTERGTDNREIRRPVVLKELYALAGSNLPEIIPVVEVFRREGRTFLMPPPSVPLNEESLIDISHESLIRNWQRLKEWVDEEAISAQIYERLAETATLYDKGQAGLWRDPDLQLALDWRQQRKPTQAWAERYHPSFETAMSFLDASVAARDATALEAERQLKREMRRARRTAVIFGLLFLLSLAAFLFAYTKSVQAGSALKIAETQAEIARQRSEEAQLAQDDALIKRLEAERATAAAKDAAEIALVNEKKAEVAKRSEAEQRVKAVSEGERNRQLLYAADVNLTQQAYEVANIERGRELIESHQSEITQGPLARFEWAYLWRIFHSESDTIKGHTNSVTSVAYSPDGKVLASSSTDKTIKLWDSTTHRELATLPDANEVLSLAFSPDGKLLAAGNRDGEVKLWDVASQSLLDTLSGHRSGVSVIVFSPDGHRLAAGGGDRSAKIWDVSSRKELASLITPGRSASSINAMAFSPDGRILAAGYRSSAVAFWNATSGERLASPGIALQESPILSLCFSTVSPPHGAVLVVMAASYGDGTTRLFDISKSEALFKGEIIATLGGHAGPVTSVTFSAHGEMLATVSSDRTVKLWDSFTHKELVTFKGHTKEVSSVAFSPDGSTLATSSNDQTLKIWDIASQIKGLSEREDLLGPVRSLAFSSDGKLFAPRSSTQVMIWDTISRSWSDRVYTYTRSPSVMAVSFDGKMIATGSLDASPEATGSIEKDSNDSVVYLWDAASSYKQLTTLVGHKGGILYLSFSPDGRTLATSGGDRNIKLWDLATYKAIATFPEQKSPVVAVSFSPDGRLLATGSGDGALKLWSTTSHEEMATLMARGPGLTALTFSRNGRMLAASYKDGRVELWDAGLRKELATLKGHAKSVLSVAFSPDSRTLATGSSDESIKLWDTVSYKELLTLKGHTDAVMSVAFSPDGRTLASGSYDQTVRLWKAATREEVMAALGDGHSTVSKQRATR